MSLIYPYQLQENPPQMYAYLRYLANNKDSGQG